MTTEVTPEKKSFWSGATGLLTALTALVTAVGAVLAVLIQVGVKFDEQAVDLGATTCAEGASTVSVPTP